MRNARQVIAVALVATALCADRAAEAAPALRAQAIERSTGGLVQRITERIGRVVRRIALVETRREGKSTTLSTAAIARDLRTTDLRPWLRLSDPQLPLPPPAL